MLWARAVYSELVEEVEGVEEGAGEAGRAASVGCVWEDWECSSVTVWRDVKFGAEASANGFVSAGAGFAKSVVFVAWVRVYCGGCIVSDCMFEPPEEGVCDVAIEGLFDDMV